MILVEITAAIDAVGTLKTFRAASGQYQTSPADTPPNENFRPSLLDPASLGVNVYGNGRTAGYGGLQVGSLKLANNDGYYDSWIRYGFDGRPIQLRRHVEGLAFADMPIIFTGTVDGPPEVSRQELVLRLKDKQQVLEVPACPNTYGGTNVLPNGIDGTAADLKGRRKARIYGQVLNISPDCVNTSLLIFQVNDGPVASISAVYDRGAAYTVGADYATSALLAAATITAGSFSTCVAEGLFRLNASITGTITADVTEGSTTQLRSAPWIIQRLAVAAGLNSDEISLEDVNTLYELQPAVVGIWLREDVTAREAINSIAASIGAYAVFDIQGILRVGRLSDPAGTPLFTITDSQALSIERVAQKDGDLPITSVTLSHTKNWTVQESDLAGSVASNQVRANFLKEDWRSAVAKNDSVKLQFLLAPDYPVETLLVDATNADGGPAHTEAVRLLQLYDISRDLFEVIVHMDVVQNQPPSLMSLVSIQSARFGLNAGKLFWAIGVGLDLRRQQVVLSLWG